MDCSQKESKHDKVILGKLAKGGGDFVVFNIGTEVRFCGQVDKPWNGNEIALRNPYSIDTLGKVRRLDHLKVKREKEGFPSKVTDNLHICKLEYGQLEQACKSEALLGLTFTKSQEVASQIAAYEFWVGHHA